LLRLNEELSGKERIIHDLQKQLATATDPEYLAAAIGKVGMVDKEWQDRALDAETTLGALRARLLAVSETITDTAIAEELRKLAELSVSTVVRNVDAPREQDERREDGHNPLLKAARDAALALAAWTKALAEADRAKRTPYAFEYGKSNGDGTFSVVIERGDPVNPVPDWPITPLYAQRGSIG